MSKTLNEVQSEIKILESELENVLCHPACKIPHWLDGQLINCYSEEQEIRMSEIRTAISDYKVLAGMIIYREMTLRKCLCN